jgi:hypothetical protein
MKGYSMRKYHIYMQRTKPVGCHCNYTIYRWLPWEYIGYVTGTKNLYKYFKLKFLYSTRSIDFYYSFNYFEDEYSKVENKLDFNYICYHEYHRYLIIDDHGNVRDFYQLTDQYKKNWTLHYKHRYCGWNNHWSKLTSDQRKSITPEELDEIKYEYGITLKPIKNKRNLNAYDNERCSKVSGWKMQSKRKRQWKQK